MGWAWAQGQAFLMGGHADGDEDGMAWSSPEQQGWCTWSLDTEGAGRTQNAQ